MKDDYPGITNAATANVTNSDITGKTENTADQLLDAREHFLRNIRQLGNNALLCRQRENGRMEPVYASEGFAQMMECTAAEAMELYSGKGFIKTTDPEDRPLVRSMLKNRVAYDGSQTLTVQKITAKRNKIWVSIHYAFIDDYGEHYVYCTCSDVTALKQYEEKFRSTYSELGNSFYQVNEHTLAMVRVNLTKDSFEEIRGRDLYDTDTVLYTFSESMRHRAQNFPIGPERDRFLEEFCASRLSEDYIRGKTTVSQVLYSIRRDGRSCFVRITASVTRHPLSGDLIAFITERECNSDKVRETLMDKILAQQFDMVCYLVNGQYGVTIGQNVRARRGNIFPATLNGAYQNYLDRQVYQVLVGTEEEKRQMREALALETVERELARKEPYVVDLAVKVADEVYYKQFDFYSIDPDAKFYILLKSDTTEIQKAHLAMNDQLREALEASRQANVAKTSFLSSMSHEIRTPMNAIIGLNRLALAEPGLSPRMQDHLEKIDESARHLLGLINDVLDMSRIESGRMTIRHERFSFSDMISQINTMVEGQCRDKGLTYLCRMEECADTCYIGDATKIKQVLINILGNAVKFTPAPGEVRFLIEKTSSYEDQTVFRFTVQDTGIGMDRDYLPKIFEPFSQERMTVKNRYGSTGLGMAITKNIVDMMNGTIRVESEKDAGSTFIVTLPLQNAACDPADPEPLSAQLTPKQGAAEPLSAQQTPKQGAPEPLSGRPTSDRTGPGQAGSGQSKESSASGQLKESPASGQLKDRSASGQSEARPAPAAEKPVKKSLEGCRILLAEDMLINAEIMKEILKMKGLEVEHAENGKEAVDLFEKHPAYYYDAILMDLRMPVMDGLTAAGQIRAGGREDSETVPIIALTANAFDEDVQRSLQAGMNAHLSKPVEPDQLFQTLEKFIFA